MKIMVISIVFLSAAICAGVMGFAIQRGATCMVAAVEEVVNERRFSRLIGLLEAAVWVGGGLLLAQSLHLLGKMPIGYPVNHLTVLGGMLLGLGAVINGACIIGAIAHLGSGQWAYIATPVGFYVGILSINYFFSPLEIQQLPYDSMMLRAPPWLALLFVMFALCRLWRFVLAALRDLPSSGLAAQLRRVIAIHVWSPHAATIVIGISFLFMLLLAGAWSYSDVLAELAGKMMADSLVARSLLSMALLGGAIFGGWSAGLFHSTRISVARLIKCFVGGMLMGCGSLLIPGGNDGVLLIGMPLLWPYAWVAFAAMCTSIVIALMIEKGLARSAARQGV
jgi:hypothetical protein